MPPSPVLCWLIALFIMSGLPGTFITKNIYHQVIPNSASNLPVWDFCDLDFCLKINKFDYFHRQSTMQYLSRVRMSIYVHLFSWVALRILHKLIQVGGRARSLQWKSPVLYVGLLLGLGWLWTLLLKYHIVICLEGCFDLWPSYQPNTWETIRPRRKYKVRDKCRNVTMCVCIHIIFAYPLIHFSLFTCPWPLQFFRNPLIL